MLVYDQEYLGLFRIRLNLLNKTVHDFLIIILTCYKSNSKAMNRHLSLSPIQ